MYIFNGWFMRVRCICGREHVLRRAMVCECGTTLRAHRCYDNRKMAMPHAWAQDNYDLKISPLKMPVVVGWVEAGTR